ncbi:MAG: Gfo/Idh/MocA family oxidoreductase [Thermomicrobiales bacterium]|nr:Gfo/Idh/MocA family oxidoreductase [Thermomicrobiales bacterium]
MNPVGIGIIGAGVISEIYLKNLTTRWDHVRVIGIADILPEAAQRRADQFGVSALTVDELLAHPEVEIVVNLTIPAAHAAVSQQAIAAGKSVHTEKPLAINLDDGKAVIAAGKTAGVLVGDAPDTFLGAGLQTVRKMIDDGAIGRPIAFNARMITHGMEDWHPNPYFFYQPGAGPMLDMGPYYVTALTAILGPTASISSRAIAGFSERVVTTNSPQQGQVIPVNTPTHIESVIELESGVIGTLTTSFDLYDPEHSWFMIYGTEGSIRLPDPNTFGGPIRVYNGATREWTDVPLLEGYSDDSRGIGVADMAMSLRTGSVQRASGALGYHVLEVMLGALRSGETRETVVVESTVERPPMLEV